MVNLPLTEAGLDRRAHPPGARIGEWRAPDGWRHRRLDWPPVEQAAARGSLLFAGGRGDFIEKYLEPLAHWHRRGWAVTSFDWRGQGASRGSLVNGHLDSLDPLVDDLAALIAELRAGPGPHVAIAHSMGGHILLRAVAERRVELDAAVLVSPMLAINSGPIPSWAVRWAAAALSRSGWRRSPVRRDAAGERRARVLTSSPERYQDELWWWEKEPGFKLAAPSWGWVDAAYRSCARLDRKALGAITIPLLIVGTDSDDVVRPAAIRRAAALIPGARLHMVAGARHELLREADPMRIEALAAIDAFLDEKAPR